MVKTLSLMLRSFMNSDLQTEACALTYRTLLAIVPALALLFAIGRGFGFQALLTDQLYKLFPSQHIALEAALKFVDSYLAQASEGLFVGVGIVFLLWTLISLLGNVESSFNRIWRVRKGRSIWRKSTDYLAILLILPVLIICSGGISLTMSTALRTLLPFDFIKPAFTLLFDVVSWVFTVLFFAGTYMLIPNTKVKFGNALIAGAVVGTAFEVLQWLFLSGQMYVAKYNAIYGGFSFLPLMLIWMQLVWLFTLMGCLMCYASQNIGQFSFNDDVDHISREYRYQVTVAVMTIITQRFMKGEKALTCREISATYNIPIRLVTETVNELNEMKLVSMIDSAGDVSEHPLQPGIDMNEFTVGELMKRLQSHGSNDFIPDFLQNYASVIGVCNRMAQAMEDEGDSTLLKEIKIDINQKETGL